MIINCETINYYLQYKHPINIAELIVRSSVRKNTFNIYVYFGQNVPTYSIIDLLLLDNPEA